tara:strand:+ start:2472 stop:2651 length:180 start_codon:yes stop_codon:yes gene_type:complete
MTKQTIAEEFALKKIELRPRYGGSVSNSKINVAKKRRRAEQTKRLKDINKKLRKEKKHD